MSFDPQLVVAVALVGVAGLIDHALCVYWNGHYRWSGANFGVTNITIHLVNVHS